ncbi:PREDICTED: dynein heavy chain 17, axonemal [Calidris pugnax]|uniref:dynein heavy chain 17, axonemal n=1 Tax=Calidris pugnax TaxID=198806 RepID=UPI00071D1241|nr:PREDICTED: dynein heavy chain 17, axonemal [Calidris pugnax]
MSDERHRFLESFATLLLRVQPDEWNKFLGSEEAMAEVDEFFRQQDVQELVLGLNPAGLLQPTTCFSPALKAKAIYFVKKKEENITQENCQSALLVGDIAPSPVEQFITVMEEVGGPQGWALGAGARVEPSAGRMSDERHRFLESFATLLLRVQPDEWNKFLGSEEAMAEVDEFFRQQDVQELVLGLNPAGLLQPTTCFSPALKAKAIYFVKKKEENITQENCQSALLVGDIAPSPVEQFITVMEEVLFPLLLSEDNVAGWPRVVVEDIRRRTHQLKNELFMMSGKIQGKPLLPLPEHLFSQDGSSTVLESLAGPVDISVLHSIETVVIEWSHQIRDILSKDSAQPLLEGLHPLPRTEFEFWQTRMDNLQCINDQLLSPRVAALAEMLEKANSCYWPALQSMFKDVSSGLEEAKDISLYLQPLQLVLEELEQTDYSQLQPHVDRTLCTVRLLRAHCQHYSTPAHVIVILQEICNLLIEMTRNFLSPEDVMKGLQGETEETLEGIKLSISTIEKFLQSYSTYCSNLLPVSPPEEPQLWEFPRSLVFRRMDSFLHRLKIIKELYETVIEFRQLEKAELGGVRGNILGTQVFQTYEEVSELSKSFADCKYDPLDPAEEQLNKDFAEFQKKIQHTDRRLATILCQGFDDCNCLASAMKVKWRLLPVEFPLVASELEAVDSQLASAENTLSWNHEGVMEYIEDMRDILYDLQARVQKAKLNMEKIRQLMEECSATPLFKRKDNKETALLDLEGKVSTLTKRYAAIRDTGTKIHEMVKENENLFKADKSSQVWLNYVGYLDEIVMDGFFNLIHKSLQLLLNNMAPDAEVAPLFEVRMELRDGKVQYCPSLESGEEGSFLGLMESLLNDIFSAAACIPRLLEGRQSYKISLEEQVDLSRMREEVVSLVVSAIAEGQEYSAGFEEQAHLWLQSPEEFLQHFLTLGSVPSPKELELQPEVSVAQGTPSLQLFKQEIDTCKELCEEVSGFSNTKVFGGWLQSDCRPFKQALLSTVRSQGMVLRQHLINHITTSLQELQDFIREANAGLNKPLEEGDYEGLVEVMGHLNRVEERQAETDGMFQPLQEMVALLSTYGEEMPEEIHLQLQELPKHWDSTKKLCLQVKQSVAPLQAK